MFGYNVQAAVDAKNIEYRNKEACSKCLNREKCTNAKGGKIIQKDKYNLAVEHMVNKKSY